VFAYVVKRLLSGVVVLFLISMSVFLLFWYGPSEPAQTICDNDTSNRCTPARLEVFRENLGFNNPWYEEYGTFMKGVVAGREIQFGSTTKFDCPAPCLGYSYRTKAPVFEEMLVESGFSLTKLWFSVTHAEQRTRIAAAPSAAFTRAGAPSGRKDHVLRDWRPDDNEATTVGRECAGLGRIGRSGDVHKGALPADDALRRHRQG